jgi:hypothetical protein
VPRVPVAEVTATPLLAVAAALTATGSTLFGWCDLAL